MAYDYRFNFYLNDKIDILFSQLIQVMDVADSTVEGGDLIAGDLAFSELFLKPWSDEILWLFQGNLVRVVNGDIETGDSVGDDGDACAHLARTDDTEGFDTTTVMLEEQSFRGESEHL